MDLFSVLKKYPFKRMITATAKYTKRTFETALLVKSSPSNDHILEFMYAIKFFTFLRMAKRFKTRKLLLFLWLKMTERRNYEFLEHTADAYVAAYGKDLAEAFENAAVAMFDVMTEVEKVKAEVEDHVEVEADDEYALLYSWLEDLLVKSDINRMLYSKFKISSIEKTPDRFGLKARIWGEKFNPEKHPQKVGVKAVTYHRMEILKEPNKVTLKFILDI